MMDKNKIIGSGLLERYLLGDLSENEVIEVERYIQNDGKAKEHFQQLEADFEKMAMENAITPPEQVKTSLMEQIENDIPAEAITITRKRSLRPYLSIAASIAILFGLTTLWLSIQLDQAKEDLKTVQTENETIDRTLEDLTEDLTKMKSWYTAINNPNTIQLFLKGNERSPDALAISYINHKEKTVILNASGLPKLAADKDYQLWADVDGEMIDMGVIKKDEAMLAMKYIENAESLNITIEPAGGNDHPTVSRLISNVYL